MSARTEAARSRCRRRAGRRRGAESRRLSGTPVDPDVYITYAMSSLAVSGNGRFGADPRRVGSEASPRVASSPTSQGRAHAPHRHSSRSRRPPHPSSVDASRSGGCVGSSGTYAHPAYSMPRNATISSGERSMQTPTLRSRRTPCSRRRTRQLPRATIEFGVGQRARAVDHRHGIGRALHLLGEQRRHRPVARKRGAGPVPVDDDPLPLLGRDERKARNRPVGIARNLVQQRDVVRPHALDGRLIEEVGVVFEFARQAIVLDVQQKGEVRLGRRIADANRHAGQSRRAPAAGSPVPAA